MLNEYLAQLNILSWSDVVEILIFTGTVYACSRWLAAARSKRLLLYAYVLCLCFGLAYINDLQTISLLGMYIWPVLMLIFIVIRLQQKPDHVPPKTIVPAKQSEKEWIPIMLRAAFKGLQYKKELTFVIQGNQPLNHLLNKPIEVHSNITHGLLDILIESNSLHHDRIVWLDSTGTLLAFNGQWNREIDFDWATQHAGNYSAWEQEALFWTGKTDAVILRVDPESRLITIIAQGTHAPGLNSEQAQTIIAQYVRKCLYGNRSTIGSQPCLRV